MESKIRIVTVNISDLVTISNLSSKGPIMSSEASKCSSISLVIPSAILIKIVCTGPSSAWNALAYLVEQALTVIL